MKWKLIGAAWNATADEWHAKHGVVGILYGSHGWGQLFAQIAGCLTLAIVMFGVAYGFFKIQNKLTKGGIRSSAEDELVGLDMPEMGVLAYPEFDKAPEVSADLSPRDKELLGVR